MKMKVDASLILGVCESSNTMRAAHAKLGQLKYDTFAKYAKFLGCYKPNPGAKGISKHLNRKNYLYYTNLGNPITSNRLKLILIRDGVKRHQCEICLETIWNGLSIPIELDHIDGNHFNNKLENLRIVCPNCHSQTTTNSGKKNKNP